MCDYSASPVWAKNGGACELSELPVSAGLAARLWQWQLWYEKWPLDGSNWPDLDAFSAEGEAIAYLVKSELPNWTVIYYHEAKAEAFFQGKKRPVNFKKFPRTSFEYEIGGTSRVEAGTNASSSSV